jgi:hypothetical protein
MKKIFSICLLLIIVAQFAKAQTVTATGTVKDGKGNPVSFAFVYNAKLKNATYCDSLGNFSLAVSPQSKLFVRCKGYADEFVDIGNKTDFQVVLKSNGEAGDTREAMNKPEVADSEDKLDNTFSSVASVITDSEYSLTEGTAFTGHKKGNVHGSRYLFENWVHGYIISPQDSLFQNPNYLFNYDKIGGGLLFTPDGKKVLQVNSDQIKSFKLFDGGTPYSFEKVPAIDNVHFVQVLASGKNYKIYKLITTDFVKADYTTNGFTTHGNDYDEFVDNGKYFVLDVKTNQLEPLSLRKKSIKTVFAGDGDKVAKFMKDNSGDYDDAYLSSLGDYLNN